MLRPAVLETLESRQLMCATHAVEATAALIATGRVPTTAVAPQLTTVASTGEAVGPFKASPGQTNGTGNWGGGIYGAAATSFSTRADGLPILNSLAGAPFTVFIDFDGWTGNGYGGQQTHTPFDRDGNSATFSATEANEIAEGWRRMASYMAPFNVNVSTVQPTSTAKDWSWSVIANSGGGYSWSQLGGFAPSAFNGSNELLSRFSGVLHELGHNFSLAHQSAFNNLGVETADYRGKIDSIHGVIMGVDYDGYPSKWIAGHTANGYGIQDDVAVIANKIKAFSPAGADGFRPDDFGGTTSVATPLTLSSGVQTSFGVVERLGDADAFAFTSGGGRYTLSLTPDSPSSLDGKLEIYNAGGALLSVVDEPLKVDATVTMSLPAGDYYAVVKGHSNYDDVGTYQIKVAAATGSITTPIYNTLAAPANPAVALANGSGLTVTWSPVSGATSYVVERSTDGVNFTTAGTVTTTSYTDASLFGSARYTYRIGAKDASGTSVPSTAVSIVNRPSAVTALRISSLSTSQLVLDWIESTGETGYRIEQSTDGTNFTAIGTSGTNTNSYNITGLATGAAYWYRVVPTSSLGDGAASAVVTSRTRLPVVTGLVFTAKQPTSLSLSWTAQSAATGYRIERSVDGKTFSVLTTTAAGVTTYTNTALTAASEYYYRVSAMNGTQPGVTSAVVFTATPAATPPPSPWVASDIGTQAGAGATSYNSSTGAFTVVSNGADVWGTADQLRYTYQPLSGNGTIIARVATEENTSGWAKVGVMFRESTAANSRHAMMVISPENGAALQYRTATGGSSTNVATTSIAGAKPVAPYWVKLTRAGNVFTGFASTDGTNWTQVGQATITMASSALVGLAASSINSAVLNTSTIDNVSIQTPNRAPTAGNDTASTTEATAISIAVLVNDTDPDGDPLTISTVATPAHGTAVINGSQIVYTPASGYSGTDSFTYTISDGRGGVSTATVGITIAASNRLPVAGDDTASTVQDSAVAISVLTNDSDPDGDTLSITTVATPTHGTAVAGSDGKITYTPAAGYSGIDSFTYTVADGRGGTATATVGVTITALNRLPTAGDDSVTTLQDSPVTVVVLTNDSDPDGDTLSVDSVSTPAHGVAAINPDGSITYTPATGYSGSDSFTYSITDGRGGTATATVGVTVTALNRLPVAGDDSLTTLQDSPATVVVLTNDSDPDSDPLSVTGASSAGHGSTAVNDDGSITYTPAPGYSGPDSFTYTIGDGRGGSATGTVAVTVTAVNAAPTAGTDTAAVAEDASTLISVLTNDTDANGDALSVSATALPTNGTAVIQSGGRILYTPKANFFGADSFTYTVSDGLGGSATGTVNVSVTAVNDAPTVVTAAKAATSTVTGTNVLVSVLGTDIDDAATALKYSWSLQSGPAAVAFGGNGTNAAKQTSATFSKAGAYTLKATIVDAAGATVTSTMSVQVVATAAAIRVTPTTATVQSGATKQLAAAAYDQFNLALVTQPKFTWTLTGVGGISQTGLFTGGAAGNSTVSAAALGLRGSAVMTTTATPPNAASNLTATKLTGRTVLLKWLDNTVRETGFYVQTSTNGTTWSTYASRPASTGSGLTVQYTTGTFAAGKRYFRIVAFNLGGVARASNVVLVTL